MLTLCLAAIILRWIGEGCLVDTPGGEEGVLAVSMLFRCCGGVGAYFSNPGTILADDM